MKPIKQIKEELQVFGKKYKACKEGLEAIKGNNLKELFQNINTYIFWCKKTPERGKEFNAIFDNELVIEDGVLLCNCTNLTMITIPESVTLIMDGAFSQCTELTSIIIPNSVTSIGEGAFQNCTELTSVTILNSVTSIGIQTFQNCTGLTSITIPNSVTSIGYFAFAYCIKLTSIIIPNSVTSINNSTFFGCREDLQIIRK